MIPSVRLRTSLVVASLATLTLASSAHAAPPLGYTLTFSDDFTGPTLDTTAWLRRYKWGEAPVNGELQAYVDDAFQISDDGILTIVGDKRAATYAGQTFQYASGVLCSVHEQTYGYFEARLKVPAGKGMWPAFWLLGANGTTGVNEIDIHEILGNDPKTVYLTVHWGTDYGAGHMSDGSSWVGPDFSADFHVFGLEWTPGAIVWTIDGVERKRHTGAGVPQVPMYVILNLAIGGDWPGAPDATTTFPGRYQIDYVRAYAAAPDGGAGEGGGGGGAMGGGATGGGGSAGDGGDAGGGATDGGGCGCRLAPERTRVDLLAGVLAIGLLVRRGGRRCSGSRSARPRADQGGGRRGDSRRNLNPPVGC